MCRIGVRAPVMCSSDLRSVDDVSMTVNVNFRAASVFLPVFAQNTIRLWWLRKAAALTASVQPYVPKLLDRSSRRHSWFASVRCGFGFHGKGPPGLNCGKPKFSCMVVNL